MFVDLEGEYFRKQMQDQIVLDSDAVNKLRTYLLEKEFPATEFTHSQE